MLIDVLRLCQNRAHAIAYASSRCVGRTIGGEAVAHWMVRRPNPTMYHMKLHNHNHNHNHNHHIALVATCCLLRINDACSTFPDDQVWIPNSGRRRDDSWLNAHGSLASLART